MEAAEEQQAGEEAVVTSSRVGELIRLDQLCQGTLHEYRNLSWALSQLPPEIDYIPPPPTQWEVGLPADPPANASSLVHNYAKRV